MKTAKDRIFIVVVVLMMVIGAFVSSYTLKRDHDKVKKDAQACQQKQSHQSFDELDLSPKYPYKVTRYDGSTETYRPATYEEIEKMKQGKIKFNVFEGGDEYTFVAKGDNGDTIFGPIWTNVGKK